MVIKILQLTGDYTVSTVKTHINKQQEQAVGNAMQTSLHASRAHINKSETLQCHTLQTMTTSIMEYTVTLKNESLSLTHFIMDVHFFF